MNEHYIEISDFAKDGSAEIFNLFEQGMVPSECRSQRKLFSSAVQFRINLPILKGLA